MQRTLFSIAFFAALLHGAAKEAKSPEPHGGVKTPGVRIPFSTLVSDSIEAPANPGWLFFARSLYAPGPDSIVPIEARTNKPATPLGGMNKPCGGMVSAFGSLWTSQCGNGDLLRIDPKTGKAAATIAAGVSPVRGAIAASADSIWLLSDGKTTLSRIDPDQNLVVAGIRLPVGCQGLTFAEKALWVACPAKNKVLRINAATNLLEQSIEVSAKPIAIAAGSEGAIWVLCGKDGKLDRIDSKTNKVAKTIELGVPDVEGALAFGEGWLWVTQPGFPLTRIDTKQEAVAQQFFGAGGGSAIAVSPGAIWLGSAKGIQRIDPKRVLATLSLD